MIPKHRLEILVATGNPGKIREIQEALRFSSVKLRFLNEFQGVSPVEEVGQTYEENAVLKALGYSRQTGVSALADDSGLEVDALGGIPGVLSARFGGDRASDPDRINKLLVALSQLRKETDRAFCLLYGSGWMATGGRNPEHGGSPIVEGHRRKMRRSYRPHLTRQQRVWV